MKKILIIDDHPIVLEGIQALLSAKGFSIVKAGSADMARMAIQHIRDIDMAVCDLQLDNNTDGLDLIADMRRNGYNGPAIIYTMHDELWNVPRLQSANLDGIVLKGDSIDELILAIDTVAGGGKYYSPAFMKRKTETLQINGILSSRSLEILELIAQGKGNREIADSIFVGEKAVEYHRTTILKKLNCKNMTEAVSRAINLGLIRGT